MGTGVEFVEMREDDKKKLDDYLKQV